MKASKKEERTADVDKPCVQYAALPWRCEDRPEILLVSTRGTRRWIIPKGWPMKGRAPHEAAAREALEEAGVVGKTRKRSFGSFNYVKRVQNGELPCKVLVFPLGVTSQRKTWPESAERVTRWFSLHDAAAAVREPELSRLILDFDKSLAARLKTAAKKSARGAPRAGSKTRAKKKSKAAALGRAKRTN